MFIYSLETDACSRRISYFSKVQNRSRSSGWRDAKVLNLSTVFSGSYSPLRTIKSLWRIQSTPLKQKRFNIAWCYFSNSDVYWASGMREREMECFIALVFHVRSQPTVNPSTTLRLRRESTAVLRCCPISERSHTISAE